jgi:hypothetical protein
MTAFWLLVKTPTTAETDFSQLLLPIKRCLLINKSTDQLAFTNQPINQRLLINYSTGFYQSTDQLAFTDQLIRK